jgi:hypothetical protein
LRSGNVRRSHQRKADEQADNRQSDRQHDDDLPPLPYLVPVYSCMVADVVVMMAMAHWNLDFTIRQFAGGRK